MTAALESLQHLFLMLVRLGLYATAKVYFYRFWFWVQNAAPNRTVSVFVEPLGAHVRLRPHTSDFHVLGQVAVKLEYEFDDLPQAEAIARVAAETSQPVILDAGAHIGLAALYFAHRFPTVQVIAVEPEPGNFQILETNTAEHPNIRAIRAAVWGTRSEVSVISAGSETWAARVSEDNSASDHSTCSAYTVPDLLQQQQADSCLVMKIDVEGAEGAIFAKDATWVDDIPVIIIELHDYMIPWTGAGHRFLQAATRRPRDWLLRGENLICIDHVLRPAAAKVTKNKSSAA
ncbi:MAG: FkbM family methyltransferase [Geminicoccaceae bacterium]